MVLALCLLGMTEGAKLQKSQTFLAAPHNGSVLMNTTAHQPTDKDHFVDELHNNSVYSKGAKPASDMQKDFVALDLNGDKKLTVQELMYRQFYTGCEPMEAQVRAKDYFTCGDTNKDKFIDQAEFTAAATTPAFAECIKKTSDRRAHGFVRFFSADADMDGFLTKTELKVGLINLWGQPGEVLTDDLMKCADKDKDGKISQTEFHDMIATYNPMTREWQMWSGTSDKSILTCMKPAFAKFDAALVFEVTDTNKDDQISKSETYGLMTKVAGASIDPATTNKIFEAADLDKNGYLSAEEFEKAGASYAGPAGTNTSMAFYLGGHAKWPTSTYDEGYGMSVPCRNAYGEQWRVFSDDLGKVQVVPKKPWNGTVEVKQRNGTYPVSKSGPFEKRAGLA